MLGTDTSDTNEEGLTAHKIKVVEKVIKYYDMDPPSVSPIRIDGVISVNSRVLNNIWYMYKKRFF